jgi:hypothetical protein
VVAVLLAAARARFGNSKSNRRRRRMAAVSHGQAPSGTGAHV